MKITRETTARWIREAVKLFQYPLAIIGIVIVASLLPGDNQHIGTFAAFLGLVLLAALDAAVSVPALIVAKRLERPALAPVKVRSDW